MCQSLKYSWKSVLISNNTKPRSYVSNQLVFLNLPSAWYLTNRCESGIAVTADISWYHIYLHEFTWVTLLNLFRQFCSQFKSLQDTYKFMYMYQMYVQCIAHYILFMLTLLHLKCILLHMHYESVFIYMHVSNIGTLLYN